MRKGCLTRKMIAWLLCLMMAIELMPAETLAWVGPVFGRAGTQEIQFIDNVASSAPRNISCNSIVMQNDYLRFELDKKSGTIMRIVPARTADESTLAGDVYMNVYQELQFRAKNKKLTVASAFYEFDEQYGAGSGASSASGFPAIVATYFFEEDSNLNARVVFTLVRSGR